jgi:hypothetical protein
MGTSIAGKQARRRAGVIRHRGQLVEHPLGHPPAAVQLRGRGSRPAVCATVTTPTVRVGTLGDMSDIPVVVGVGYYFRRVERPRPRRISTTTQFAGLLVRLGFTPVVLTGRCGWNARGLVKVGGAWVSLTMVECTQIGVQRLRAGGSSRSEAV